jgi:hypothetical protein
MTEEQSTQEITRLPFNDKDATALENWIFGNSYPIKLPSGERVLVSQDNLGKLYQQNPQVLKTPINILSGVESVEEVNKARQEQQQISGMMMTLFGIEKMREFMQKGLTPVLKLPLLDENGQVQNVQVVLMQGEEEISVKNELSSYIPDEMYKEILEEPVLNGNTLVLSFKKPNI